jgi:hypothetical protein
MNLHPILLASEEIFRWLLGRLVPRNSGKGDICKSFEGHKKSWCCITQRRA